MTIFTTITDIRNHADGMIGDTTPDQNEALVTYIRDRGYDSEPSMSNPPDEVKRYLASIGRKGGKAPSPHKKYESNAERQKAYRNRKKNERLQISRREGVKSKRVSRFKEINTMTFKQTTRSYYIACRRFRNYVRHLQRYNHQLSDKQIGCFARELGLSIWDMDRILNEQNY